MSFFDTQFGISSGKQHRKKHDDKGDKPHKHDKRQKADKHAYTQSTKPEETSANSASDNVDFLFVVNELTTDARGRAAELDLWGDVLPFRDASDYAEIPGEVFRYRNGEVTKAHDCWWVREHGGEGRIWRWVPGTEEPKPAEVYKTYSIFRRWRHSPIVWVGSDISVHGIDPSGADPLRTFTSLRFDTRPPGVSRISYLGRERYVAGRDPSWMSSLVPQQYSNPFANAPRSQGLQGELPVILGLMALSAGSVFEPQAQWQRRHWRGDPQINQDLCPGPNELPRGVVVQVCYDPADGEGATWEDIERFEWDSIVVKG